MENHEQMDTDEVNNSFENLSNEPYDNFEFEKQLTSSIVEELRLKRKLEKENENMIKSLLDEKYDMERKLDKQKRLHQNEKVLLEEKIFQLKKTVEDGFCMKNDAKENRQVVVQTLQEEIGALKDEACVQHAEKLSQEKKNKELEGKLKVCNSFQQTTFRQVNETRQHTKSLMQYCEDLSKKQEELKKSVSHAITEYAELHIRTDRLLRTVSILKKKNSSLKQEVISLVTQLQLQKDSPTVASEAVELLKNSEPRKETVKNEQCDVGIQYEVVDQSEDSLPTAAKYQKSTNTAGQDFEEKYFEHVSVQMYCQGSSFSNFDKSQDACFQPSTGFVHACVSDTSVVCGKSSSVDLHGNCSRTNESKRDKGSLLLLSQ